MLLQGGHAKSYGSELELAIRDGALGVRRGHKLILQFQWELETEGNGLWQFPKFCFYPKATASNSRGIYSADVSWCVWDHGGNRHWMGGECSSDACPVG